jgi:hypothetical protein
MLAAGWSFEEIMEHLAQRGLSFADVGLGYCRGQKEIQNDDGSKQLPPCLGQLKCNPNRCKNAVIPESKIPIWLKMYEENKKRLNDPLMAHAKSEIEEFVNEAREVLKALGVKMNEI